MIVTVAVSGAPAQQPPANDDFGNAQILNGACSSITGSNRNATRQDWEKNVRYAGSLASRSVWYAWTAPASGTTTFDTTGSNFDTVLVVYTRPSSAGALQEQASNNDASSGVKTSRVQFSANRGVKYYIVVDGDNGQAGRLKLTWTAGTCAASAGPAPAPAAESPASAGTAGHRPDVDQEFSASGSLLSYCDTLRAGKAVSLQARYFYIPVRLDICLEGFQPGTVYMQIIRGDGTVRPPEPQPVLIGTSNRWSYMIPLIDPPGVYVVKATQGNTVATGTFDLRAVRGPELAIYPAAAPSGSVFTVYLVDFPRNQRVLLHEYRQSECTAASGVTEYNKKCYAYQQSFTVDTNSRGQAVASLTLDGSAGQYFLMAAHPSREVGAPFTLGQPVSTRGHLLQNALSQKCIDVKGPAAVNNEAPLQLWDCEWTNPSTDQRWEWTPDGFIRNTLSNRCIDVRGRPGVTRESQLQLWDCEFANPANTDQRWVLTSDGYIKNTRSGLCIDVRGKPGRDNEAPLQLWDCEFSEPAKTDQRWSLR
jgi:hypothetical protein